MSADMFRSLGTDPQLQKAFQEMQAGGVEVIQNRLCFVFAISFFLWGKESLLKKYYNDPTFLHAVSVKMGGVPAELKAAMRTLPEACKAGDVAGVQKLLDAGISPDTIQARL